MRDLSTCVREVAVERGVELSESELGRVLSDLRRWLRKEGREGRVRTADGSFTLVSGEFGEPYHSLTAGAVTECVEKFVRPSRLLERVRSKRVVRILDVGFGLGYNTAVAVEELRRVYPGVEIEVVALEKRVPSDVPPLPEPYRNFHRRLFEGLPSFREDGVRVELLLGDARRRVQEVVGFGADAVFHDPFSPFRNPELWTLEFLSLVKSTMSEEGVWVSYTSALPVRRALLELGFRVGSSPPVGRRRGGTVAVLRGDTEPMEQEEVRKLLTSPYSTPMRDPDLSRDPLFILVDYRISVLLKEREISSGTLEEEERRR